MWIKTYKFSYKWQDSRFVIQILGRIGNHSPNTVWWRLGSSSNSLYQSFFGRVRMGVLHPLTLSSPVRTHTVFAGAFLYLLRQMGAQLLSGQLRSWYRNNWGYGGEGWSSTQSAWLPTCIFSEISRKDEWLLPLMSLPSLWYRRWIEPKWRDFSQTGRRGLEGPLFPLLREFFHTRI